MTSDTPRTRLAPMWIRGWLLAAGAYNVVWGAAMVLAPLWTLKHLGVSPSNAELQPHLPRLWVISRYRAEIGPVGCPFLRPG